MQPWTAYLGIAINSHNIVPLIPKAPLLLHIMVNLPENQKPFVVWLKV
jgi:hypothetical protein